MPSSPPSAAISSGRRRAAEMYPEGFATRIVPGGAALGLESDFRPHFFAAASTVCCKLFNAATPDVAVFGEKDYQQLCVVRQMVRDLNLAVRSSPSRRRVRQTAWRCPRATPICRHEERAIAPALHRVLLETPPRPPAAVRGPGNAPAKRPRPAPLLRDPRARHAEPQLPELDAICEDAAARAGGRGVHEGRLRRRARGRDAESRERADRPAAAHAGGGVARANASNRQRGGLNEFCWGAPQRSL